MGKGWSPACFFNLKKQITMKPTTQTTTHWGRALQQIFKAFQADLQQRHMGLADCFYTYEKLWCQYCEKVKQERGVVLSPGAFKKCLRSKAQSCPENARIQLVYTAVLGAWPE